MIGSSPAPSGLTPQRTGVRSLALAAALRDSGDALPKRLVLLTPFVDVELLHADIARIAPDDPMLGVDGAREAGRLYAGELGTSHPSISPARGSPAGLPPMKLFVGTRDIVCPDALEYARQATECGCDVDLPLRRSGSPARQPDGNAKDSAVDAWRSSAVSAESSDCTIFIAIHSTAG